MKHLDFNLSKEEKKKIYNFRYHEKLKKIIREAKDKPCIDCNVKYPYYVMDFDHRNGKDKVLNMGLLVNFGRIERIKKEIAKCDVVCSNCHRIRTHKENKYNLRYKDRHLHYYNKMLKLKMSGS